MELSYRPANSFRESRSDIVQGCRIFPSAKNMRCTRIPERFPGFSPPSPASSMRNRPRHDRRIPEENRRERNAAGPMNSDRPASRGPAGPCRRRLRLAAPFRATPRRVPCAPPTGSALARGFPGVWSGRRKRRLSGKPEKPLPRPRSLARGFVKPSPELRIIRRACQG